MPWYAACCAPFFLTCFAIPPATRMPDDMARLGGRARAREGGGPPGSFVVKNVAPPALDETINILCAFPHKVYITRDEKISSGCPYAPKVVVL